MFVIIIIVIMFINVSSTASIHIDNHILTFLNTFNNIITMLWPASTVRASQKNGRDAEDKVKKRIELLGPYAEALLLDRYGCHHPNSQISLYAQNMADRLSRAGDENRVIVTRRWESANACALPNGTIFISDWLVRMCDFEEELAFVLRHESAHVERKHTERRFNELNSGRKLLTLLGTPRLQEYEADVRSMIATSEKGVNPYGSVTLLEKFYEMERASHGSADLRPG